MELNDIKEIVMIQDEYTGDYDGHCPHCGEIFYLPIGYTVTKDNPVHKCMFCGGWVRLFQIIEPF